ncbi:hypothetical protein ACLSU7_10045 [Bdellovibrio sp. HCB185ZH]|uniref:hypothetical protein n=1 Tax=Bdellovibrio sp. HCB185ZH TaxID=3394235 RepID=UPI0039A772A1
MAANLEFRAMNKIAAFLLSCLTSFSAFGFWDLNDVSYLMPLPRKVGQDQLLSLKSNGAGGPILPVRFMDTIPPLSPVMTQDQTNEALRVVAMRIDPCFPLPTPQNCQRQLRLVWQPLEDGRFKAQTVDAALHSFYVLTDEEFISLLNDLQAWKYKYQMNTTGLPLQVHPVWAHVQENHSSITDFNNIVLKYAGLKNLSRVTAMVLRGAGDMWAFGGFDVKGGKLQMFKIHRTDRAAQAFINRAVPADHFDQGMISPAPEGNDTINKIIVNSANLQTGNEELIRKEVFAAYRIENPKVFHAENMDCVSCHVAQTARDWAFKKRADINYTDLFQAASYQNAKYNMQNVTPILGHTQNIRAFGYFIENVAISQRVINESAEVADVINQFVSSQR